MIAEIQSLMERYLEWLRDKSQLRAIGDCVEVTTPYLDRHNDYLQLYIKRENGHFLLTDEGYTIQDLQLSGCNLESRRRQDLLRSTLNGFGVQLVGDALTVTASRENFSLRKHNLVQAMLAVNDLFYLATPAVTSLFLEDATSWLEANDIRYVANARFHGKSGYGHRFDFAIPKSKRRPERLVSAINRPDRDSAVAMAFAWVDTKETRPEGSEAYALLNDSESRLLNTVLEALKSYDVHPIAWSEREKFKEQLVA